MREEFDVPMLRAELVGLDASTWFRSVLLDRGRNHGVHSGMPLISEQGLVGLVTATSRNAAKGMLLLDRQSAVSVVVQRSRARGVVRGVGDGLVFEFVGRDADVAPGDILITSGLGGVFPKSLRVGAITAVEEEGAQLLREASVEPVVDFGRLEQVFVMLQRGPTMDLLYATEGGDVPDEGAGEGDGS
jgi:rod shape-determining protein MreC